MIDRKVIKKEFEPGLWEKIYYPECFRGLCITSWHFIRNMWRHTLRYVLHIKPKESGFVTIQYPEELRPLSPVARLRHRLMLRPDGSIKCVACMMCETICPCNCIHITPGERDDPTIEKYAADFQIDLLRCCFCGLCVEACPEDAIRMDAQYLDLAGYSRDHMVLQQQTMLDDGELSRKFQVQEKFKEIVAT
jgi:NADH-quinone oxidoreductase subunit I